MIELTSHAERWVVAVRAQPGARRNAIVGIDDGAIKIAVTAPPERAERTRLLAEVLAGAVRLKKAQVELLSGPASRDKRFLLRSFTVEEVHACRLLRQTSIDASS